MIISRDTEKILDKSSHTFTNKKLKKKLLSERPVMFALRSRKLEVAPTLSIKKGQTNFKFNFFKPIRMQSSHSNY